MHDDPPFVPQSNDKPILLMSDKAHFDLKDMVNQRNCRYWALEDLRELHKRRMHNPKVTVWSAVGKAALIGLYFFLIQ